MTKTITPANPAKTTKPADAKTTAATAELKTGATRWRGRKSAQEVSAAPRLRRGLSILKLAAAVSVLTVGAGAIGPSAQAGSIYPPNGYAFAIGCGTGSVFRRLPVVLADTSGVAWEITEVLQWNGIAREFQRYMWTDYRYQSIQAGQASSPVWQEYTSGRGTEHDMISVSSGYYYVLRHWVFVDNRWVIQVSDYCFA